MHFNFKEIVSGYSQLDKWREISLNTGIRPNPLFSIHLSQNLCNSRFIYILQLRIALASNLMDDYLETALRSERQILPYHVAILCLRVQKRLSGVNDRVCPTMLQFCVCASKVTCFTSYRSSSVCSRIDLRMYQTVFLPLMVVHSIVPMNASDPGTKYDGVMVKLMCKPRLTRFEEIKLLQETVGLSLFVSKDAVWSHSFVTFSPI